MKHSKAIIDAYDDLNYAIREHDRYCLSECEECGCCEHCVHECPCTRCDCADKGKPGEIYIVTWEDITDHEPGQRATDRGRRSASEVPHAPKKPQRTPSAAPASPKAQNAAQPSSPVRVKV